MKLKFRLADVNERSCLCPGKPSESDRCSFVVSHWSSSYKKSHQAGSIWHEDYAEIMHKQIDGYFKHHDLKAILACEATDPRFIYGFIVGDVSETIPVVYYVYVKESYRRAGIARALFTALGVDPHERLVYVKSTPDAIELKSKLPLARFNPNELRYSKENRRHPL